MKHLKPFFESKSDLYSLCREYNPTFDDKKINAILARISNYKINPTTNLVDIKGDVDLDGRGAGSWYGAGRKGVPLNLTDIPLPFGVVEGSFNITYNQLSNLKNSPREVGHFDVSYNNLTSLEGGPDIINGSIFFEDNPNLYEPKWNPVDIAGGINQIWDPSTPIAPIVNLFEDDFFKAQEVYEFIRDKTISKHRFYSACKDHNLRQNRIESAVKDMKEVGYIFV